LKQNKRKEAKTVGDIVAPTRNAHFVNWLIGLLLLNVILIVLLLLNVILEHQDFVIA